MANEAQNSLLAVVRINDLKAFGRILGFPQSPFYTIPITVDTVISQSIVSITFFIHKNDCPIFMDKGNFDKIFRPFLTDSHD